MNGLLVGWNRNLKGITMERTYKYLCYKQYEPFGYRWIQKPLPSWITFSIKEESNSKTVIVRSNIHVNKEVYMNPTYTNSFSDDEIIKDISSKIASMFL